jgi:hypothetical protein
MSESLPPMGQKKKPAGAQVGNAEQHMTVGNLLCDTTQVTASVLSHLLYFGAAATCSVMQWYMVQHQPCAAAIKRKSVGQDSQQFLQKEQHC